MGYVKHNFQRGDELLASQLNEMDDQIAENENIAQSIIEISDIEPINETNQIWVKETTSEVQIPTMSDLNAKPDIDLGITGAAVGKYARVKTVDGNGKPTSWDYGSGGSGGGGGGTDDYTDLINKPTINGITLNGNKSPVDLSIAEVVYPEQFGAVGDGETDDAEAIQEAIDYCILNHKKLMFQPKTYGVLPNRGNHVVQRFGNTQYALIAGGTIDNGEINRVTVDIDLNGATIQLLENETDRYCVFMFQLCDGATLRNGKIIGDRDGNPKLSGSYWDVSSVIEINECKNIIFDSVTIDGSKGDGIQIGGVQYASSGDYWTTNIPFEDYYMGDVFYNCVFRNCIRWGVEIGKGRGITFYNCRVEDNLPKGQISWSAGGIDIEPGNGYGSIFDIRFDSCSVTDNSNGAFIQSCNNARISNCYIQGIAFRTAWDCMLENTHVLNDVSIESTQMVVDGCVIKGIIGVGNPVHTWETPPSAIIRNNVVRSINFNANERAYQFNKLIIENNTVGEKCFVIGNASTDVFTGEVVYKNNRYYLESTSDAVAAGYIVQSFKNVKTVVFDNNSIVYDWQKVGLTANMIAADNVKVFRFINNLLQRIYERDIDYVSLFGKVFSFNDVGMALISGNFFNPDNTVFSTQNLSLASVSITGQDNTKAVLTNNYGYDIDQVANSNDPITILADINNVWNNENPLPLYNGGVSG